MSEGERMDRAAKIGWGLGLGGVVALMALPASADPAGALIRFEAGRPIRAADFNANFEALRRAADELDARLGSPSRLTTSDRSSLVAAINELAARPAGPQGLTGPQGPQGVPGPQGPAGASGRLRLRGRFSFYDGWTAETWLASTELRPFASSGLWNADPAEVAGRPFVLRVSAQPLAGSTAATPQIGGDLVVRLDWVFVGPTGARTASQTERLTVTARTSAPTRATLTGTAPAVPDFGNGVTQADECYLRLVLESKTLVLGSDASLRGAVDVVITPPE